MGKGLGVGGSRGSGGKPVTGPCEVTCLDCDRSRPTDPPSGFSFFAGGSQADAGPWGNPWTSGQTACSGSTDRGACTCHAPQPTECSAEVGGGGNQNGNLRGKHHGRRRDCAGSWWTRGPAPWGRCGKEEGSWGDVVPYRPFPLDRKVPRLPWSTICTKSLLGTSEPARFLWGRISEWSVVHRGMLARALVASSCCGQERNRLTA